MIRETPASVDPVERAFAILDSVHQPDYTKWSIVYDPVASTVYLRTAANPQIRTFDLASFDGSCATPVKTLDVDSSATAFADYSAEANRALVVRAYAETPFLRGASEDDINDTATHPDGDVCIQPRRTRAVRH